MAAPSGQRRGTAARTSFLMEVDENASPSAGGAVGVRQPSRGPESSAHEVLKGEPRTSASALSTLPDQISKLASANKTLMGSLQQAHEDIATMLLERDALTGDVAERTREAASAHAAVASCTSVLQIQYGEERDRHARLQGAVEEVMGQRRRLADIMARCGYSSVLAPGNGQDAAAM
jgi:hypothetical protein